MTRLVALLMLFCAACSPTPAPTTATAPTPPATSQRPAVSVDHVPTERDFALGENLTFEELKAINDRVAAEKGRRKLSDLDSLKLMTAENTKASKARWLQDGKKWIVRLR